MRLVHVLLPALCCLTTVADGKIDHEGAKHPDKTLGHTGDALPKHGDAIDSRKSYTELFKAKRREQQVLVELIVKNKESKRRQLVEEAVKNAQQILEESRETLERIGHRATDSFPHNNDVLKSAISKVLENIALFSEISLRFSFLEKTMQKNRKLRTVVIWAYTYAKESELCDMDTNKVLDMMAQQHEIIPKSEKFINSYDKENAKKELEERVLQEQQRRAKVKSQHMKPVKQKFHAKMEL